MRRAIYDATPPAWRLAAHERVAAELERRGARASVRAFHVARYARPGDEAAIALLREAGTAAATTAPATAARWYAAGLRLVSDADVPRRAELLGGIAGALAAAGHLRESRDALVELLGLLGPEPTARRLSLVADCATLEGMTGQYGSARERLLEALEDAPPDGRGALLLGLANLAFYQGDPPGMREWAGRAAEAAGDPVLLTDAEGCGALGAVWDGDGEEAAALLDRATERLRGIDDAALAGRLDCASQIAGAQLGTER